MRNIAIKTDNVGDTFSAGAFNTNIGSELENICISADFSLDPEAGPDVNVNMLGQSAAAYANAGQQYQDSGIANAYVLAISTNLKSVSQYYDGMKVTFKAGNANTGASTVNVSALGIKNIKNQFGETLLVGEIFKDSYYNLVYNDSASYFEISSLTGIFSRNGRITIGSSIGVGSSDLEVVGDGDGGIAVTAPNGDPGREVFYTSFMRDSASAYRKTGSMAFQVTDNDVAAGTFYASWNIHTTYASGPGVTADHLDLAVWANHGASFFPDSLVAASAPGDKILRINNGTLLSALGDPIATPNPSAKQIVASASSENAGISILSSNTTKCSIYFGDDADPAIGRVYYDNSTDTLNFHANGSLAARFDSNRNFVIGATVAEGQLHLEKSAVIEAPNLSADNLVIKEDGNAGITIFTSTTGQGSIFFGRNGDPARGQVYYNQNLNVMSFAVVNTVRMAISSTTITMESLAGTGTRTVVADANGVLSAP